MNAEQLVGMASDLRAAHKPATPQTRACGGYKLVNGRLRRVAVTEASERFVLEHGISRETAEKMIRE